MPAVLAEQRRLEEPGPTHCLTAMLPQAARRTTSSCRQLGVRLQHSYDAPCSLFHYDYTCLACSPARESCRQRLLVVSLPESWGTSCWSWALCAVLPCVKFCAAVSAERPTTNSWHGHGAAISCWLLR